MNSSVWINIKLDYVSEVDNFSVNSFAKLFSNVLFKKCFSFDVHAFLNLDFLTFVR